MKPSSTIPSLVRDLTLLGALILVSPVAEAQDPRHTAEGFRIPEANPALSFPADHGSHPDFRIEWWYLTGHLFEEGKSRRFGVQATFFRLAGSPGAGDAGESFGEDPIFLAHMALTDTRSGRFLHEERLNRSGWDAWASVGDLDLRNGNWTLRRESGLGPGERLVDSAEGVMRLRGSVLSEARFDLSLRPLKAPVLFGENGVSKKGEEASAASLYLTFPRLRAEGELVLGNETLRVGGELWMDHEVSSSQLGRDQVGWDWLSVQFFDGRELMAYVLRKDDGSADRFSSLHWIDESGEVTSRGVDEFEWRAAGEWRSGETGDVYPIGPLVTATDPLTGERRRFRVVPVMEAQELTGGLGGVSYWEGACDVVDESDGGIVGRAYLELTGYAAGDDLGRRLRGE